MMSDPEILSKAELAREFGVSRPRISQLVDRGMPVRYDGKIDLEKACRWVVDNVDRYNDGGTDRGSTVWNKAFEWVYLFDLPAKKGD